MGTLTRARRSAHVQAVRRFNRLYTRRLRLLGHSVPGGDLSLPEARALFEVAQRAPASGAAIARALDLDAGYTSRVLARLQRRGLLQRSPSVHDGRLREYALSAAGTKTFDALGRASDTQIEALLDSLSVDAEHDLVAAMGVLERTLGPADETNAPVPEAVILRNHEPGDIGWVIARHGELYHREYDFDVRFEALVATIAAQFIDSFDATTERCWIAEQGERRLGSAFVVNGGDDSAKIRLLLVEPQARGIGLGRRLVQECVRFAAQVPYQRITLWTNDVLHAARHIYASEGFECVSREAHHSFGHDLVGEFWERPLP